MNKDTPHGPGHSPPDGAGWRAPQPGELIGGRYRVLEVVGQGGMGTVARAMDEQLHRTVAIKWILSQHVHSEETLRLFEVEARAIAGLRHENIVDVLSLGRHEGAPLLVMRYVPGGSLRGWLEAEDRAVDPALAFVRASQVASGLQALHEAGLVHGDIKPDNLLLADSGKVLIADFGLVEHVERMHSDDSLARLACTPAYAPPEVLMGETSDPPGARDVFSLGVSLYELLTGRLPFTQTSATRRAHAIMTKPLPRPSALRPDLPRGADDAVLAAMHPESSERPSAKQLIRWLWKTSSAPAAAAIRVLIVDPDAVFRDALAGAFRESFGAVELAAFASAEEALQLAASFDPDAIVSELELAAINGFELAGLAHERWPGAVRVIVTATGSPADWKVLTAIDVDGVEIKPIDAGAVAERVQALLSARHRP